MSQSLKELLAKKRVQKTQLTKLKQKLSELELESSDIELLKDKFKKLESDFIVLFEAIYVLCTDQTIDTYVKEQEEVNEIMDEIQFELHRKLAKNKIRGIESDITVISDNNVKLPKISLPIYSGSVHEWLSFRDIFKASIHQNKSLSGAMKLQYLKSSLRGDAFRIIQSISIVDSNYELAWSLLEERYSNSREQVYAHLKRFMSIPCCQNESSSTILNLIDITSECVRSLEILDQKLEGFTNIMLAYVLSQKLDANTKLWWERHLKKDNLPSLTELLDFLKDHARTLNASKEAINQKRNYPRIASMVSGVTPKNNPKCAACNQNSHNVYKCTKFLKLSVRDRVDLVKKQNLCFNCLSHSHVLKNCNSTYACRFCKKMHNSLLCYQRETTSTPIVENTFTSQMSENDSFILAPENKKLNAEATPFEAIKNKNQSFAGTANVMQNQKTVILSTACVYIKDWEGKYIRARALVDSGSMIHCVTCQLAERLQTRKERINISVSCLAGSEMNVKSKTTAIICNSSGDYYRELEFLIVPKITHITPYRYINISELGFPENIKLADPEFNKPGKIDLLLGAETFFELLRSGQLYVPNSNLVLQNTVFGHIVSGSIYDFINKDRVHCGVVSDNEELTTELRKFWEIENINEKETFKSAEEIKCNTHFIKTYKRDELGRFVVQMPLMKDPSALGDSKQFAIKQLNSLWERFSKNSKLLTLYCQFMTEYRELGHMVEVIEEKEPEMVNYIPHHAVYRPDKNSTKLRVVFNGSQVTSSGESLNSLQLNGGVIQDELFSIILRFRTHLYAFTADVKMMYRMILLDDSQRDLQRIVWKDNKSEEVKTYKLCTVTYGLKSSPYLAMRCLKQLSIDGRRQFPEAAAVVQSNVYMDDILSGASDLESAKKLQKELINLLGTCKMKLHKWNSNHPDLMETVTNPQSYIFDRTSETKALGLLWKSQTDIFSFSLLCKVPTNITKRTILSSIAQIFDPLGLIGPIVTKAKVFLQRLWRLQIDWDDTLPQKEVDEWLQFCDSFKTVNDISVDRYVLTSNAIQTTILGFADASEIAYGAVLYVVCLDSTGCLSSRLLCSKSRVAPIKTITIPRLELCAAVLLTKLTKKVITTLGISRDSTYFYSDSTIVLAWIRKSPSDLKQFVASRVATIQELSDVNQWRHVSSQNNPADLVSRGLDPEKLLHNKLWWYGGPMCMSPETKDFNSDFKLGQSDNNLYLGEIKSTAAREMRVSGTVALITDNPTFFEEFLKLSNNYDKIIRIFCYILRFLNRARNREDQPAGPLTLREITSAENRIIRAAQLPLYSQSKKTISGTVCNLNPFIDKTGIVRVGGRLDKASLPFNQKHPAILPKKCKLSEVIFYTCHKKLLHVGPQGLLNAVRLKFWPLGGRNLARKTVHSCVTCFKVKPILSSQIMGDLPSERVNISQVFNYTGLDLCGPYLVSYKNQRKGTLNKIYICVCICFVTRAIHLEMLSDLTSEALIATLKRFFARRGKCSKLFTDNATNFVGANSELKKLYKLVHFPDENLAAYLTSEAIEWNYIPQKSPHFGGLWESGVRSVKYHLKRTMGKQRFTYEEFETIVIQIEGLLNSRPLTPMTADYDNFEVLTPGHFLIGRSINAIAEPELIDKSDNRLSRWQRTTKVVQNVWKKWKHDYLNTLQQRSKWMVEKNNINVGSMVLIKEDYLPCCKWLLGRITEVYFGSDNKVRVVKVRTTTGELKRPIIKIAILPIDNM